MVFGEKRTYHLDHAHFILGLDAHLLGVIVSGLPNSGSTRICCRLLVLVGKARVIIFVAATFVVLEVFRAFFSFETFTRYGIFHLGRSRDGVWILGYRASPGRGIQYPVRKYILPPDFLACICELSLIDYTIGVHISALMTLVSKAINSNDTCTGSNHIITKIACIQQTRRSVTRHALFNAAHVLSGAPLRHELPFCHLSGPTMAN